MKRPILILLVLLAVAVAAALLYRSRGDHGPAAASSTPASGPSAEMMEAMHRMHETANRTAMTGDIDRDFVALMVPHHQSAVEMARIYLRHGKDPQLRRMSQDIVASQEAEIRQMNARGAAPAAGPVPAGDSSSGH